MKPFNFVFALVVAACVGLSFASSEGNNLLSAPTAQPVTTTAAATGECEDAEAWVNQDLVEAVKNILEKHDPHVFMTKCYSRVAFEWEKRDDKIVFARAGSAKGQLIFTNCGRSVKLADVRVDCGNKTYRIRQSAAAPAQTKEEFLQSLESHIAKHGLPKDDF